MPRTLKIIIQLLAVLFIIMLSVSSVNLGINIDKQKKSEISLQTVKVAYDLLNSLSSNLVYARVLNNIANKLVPDQSPIFTAESRFDDFIEIQKKSIQQMNEILG
jgi:hypothetical protein